MKKILILTFALLSSAQILSNGYGTEHMKKIEKEMQKYEDVIKDQNSNVMEESESVY